MQAAVDAGDRATGRLGDWASFRTLDIEFHRGVIVATDLSVLARLWDTLEPMLISQRAMGDPAYLGDRGRVVAWHAGLIDALASGDPETAAAAFAEPASGGLDKASVE